MIAREPFAAVQRLAVCSFEKKSARHVGSCMLNKLHLTSKEHAVLNRFAEALQGTVSCNSLLEILV